MGKIDVSNLLGEDKDPPGAISHSSLTGLNRDDHHIYLTIERAKQHLAEINHSHSAHNVTGIERKIVECLAEVLDFSDDFSISTSEGKIVVSVQVDHSQTVNLDANDHPQYVLADKLNELISNWIRDNVTIPEPVELPVLDDFALRTDVAFINRELEKFRESLQNFSAQVSSLPKAVEVERQLGSFITADAAVGVAQREIKKVAESLVKRLDALEYRLQGLAVDLSEFCDRIDTHIGSVQVHGQDLSQVLTNQTKFAGKVTGTYTDLQFGSESIVGTDINPQARIPLTAIHDLDKYVNQLIEAKLKERLPE